MDANVWIDGREVVFDNRPGGLQEALQHANAEKPQPVSAPEKSANTKKHLVPKTVPSDHCRQNPSDGE